MQLKKDAYEDATHFLGAVIQHDPAATVSLDDISHAFDELLRDPDHRKEAELAQNMLAECFSAFPHGEEQAPQAKSLLDILVSEKNPLDRFDGDDMDDESYAAHVPASLKVRLQKWNLWQLKRDKQLERKRMDKVKKEVVGCTFQPKLSKTTLTIVQKKKVGAASEALAKMMGEEGDK